MSKRFSFNLISSEEDGDTYEKARALRRHFLGYERLWAAIAAVYGVTLVSLGMTSWFPDMMGRFVFAGKSMRAINLENSTIARMLCCLFGLLAIGNAALAFYARNILHSEDLFAMLQVLAVQPEINDRLIQEIQQNKRRAYFKAGATFLVLAIVATLLEEPPYSYRLILLAFAIFTFQLLPQYTINENCIYNSLEVCNAEVDTIIAMMKRPTVTWTHVGEAMNGLDFRMENLWSGFQAGAVVAFLLAGRGVNAVVCIIIALRSQTLLTELAFMFMAFLVLLNALGLMWALALTTERCASGKSMHGKEEFSIPAYAALLISDDCLTQQQRIDHIRFIQVLKMHTTGVCACGVLITKDLVVSLFYQLLASFPLIMTLLTQLNVH